MTQSLDRSPRSSTTPAGATTPSAARARRRATSSGTASTPAHKHACRETFLRQMRRWGRGLDKRDITHNINFFMNVPVTSDGGLTFEDGVSAPGKYVELRAERDMLVAHQQLPAAEQPLQRLQPDAGPAAGVAPDGTRRAVRRCRGIEVLKPGTADHRAGPARAGAGCGASASRRRGRGTTCPSPSPTARSATPRRSRPGGVLRGPKLRFATPYGVAVDRRGRRRDRRRRAAAAGRVATCGPGRSSTSGRAAPGLRHTRGSGGLDVPEVLGSRSTFLLGKFGGVRGPGRSPGRRAAARALDRAAPRRRRGAAAGAVGASGTCGCCPARTGPRAPDRRRASRSCSARDVDARPPRDRTGIRLVGPTPAGRARTAARPGCTRSNIHDSAYPVGGIMLSGDTPVIVGPDGPSLGGFVVPAVVVAADRWKLAQARPGDTVRLVPVTPGAGRAGQRRRGRCLPAATAQGVLSPRADRRRGSLVTDAAAAGRRAGLAALPELVVRRAGDHHVLAEAGPPVLDLTRAGARPSAGRWHRRSRPRRRRRHGRRRPLGARPRSTRRVLPLPVLADAAGRRRAESLPILDDGRAAGARGRRCRSRSTTRRRTRRCAVTRPRCGRTRRGARTTSSSSGGSTAWRRATRCSRSCAARRYLVVGLGDVYLGAPVAVPLDPRHRLVTTKYDPARTWTPAERGRHRRHLPLRLRHGGPRRLPARRADGAGLALDRIGRRAAVAAADVRPAAVRAGRRRRAGAGACRHRRGHATARDAGRRPLRLADLQNAGLDPETVAFTEHRRRSLRRGAGPLGRGRSGEGRSMSDQPMWIHQLTAATRSPC